MHGIACEWTRESCFRPIAFCATRISLSNKKNMDNIPKFLRRNPRNFRSRRKATHIYQGWCRSMRTMTYQVHPRRGTSPTTNFRFLRSHERRRLLGYRATSSRITSKRTQTCKLPSHPLATATFRRSTYASSRVQRHLRSALHPL